MRGPDLPPRRAADVHGLRRVLFEVRTHEPDFAIAVRARDEQRAADAERLVVLGDLVALRIVGIEVVLAREDRLVRDRAAEREAELDRPLDGLTVRDRQRTWMRETHRARARGGVGEGLELAAAEHLRTRLQVHVDLEPDDGFPLRHGGPLSPRAARARCRLS